MLGATDVENFIDRQGSSSGLQGLLETGLGVLELSLTDGRGQGLGKQAQDQLFGDGEASIKIGGAKDGFQRVLENRIPTLGAGARLPCPQNQIVP